jgi:dTDP-glucose 4,6-dehydratase
MKIFVLGANSFSGQDFVDLLLDDPAHKVTGVSRSAEKAPIFLRHKSRADLSRYRFVKADMNRDMDALLALLDKERPEAIVNFAAQSEVAPSWDHPEHWFETNTVALARMVNHLRREDYLKRYLHVSSPEVYGSCENVGDVSDESTRLNPSTPYAASKAGADLLLSVYQKQFGFPLVTVRATNVYGARQQLFKIVPRTAIYLKTGRTVELHGGGEAVKSYIHVRDVSRGELSILKGGRLGELYHLSPDSGVSVKEIVRRLCERMGKDFSKATRAVAERPGQDKAYVLNSSKIRKELGWKPAINLDEGLDEVIAWMEKNWSEVSRSPFDYEHQP